MVAGRSDLGPVSAAVKLHTKLGADRRSLVLVGAVVACQTKELVFLCHRHLKRSLRRLCGAAVACRHTEEARGVLLAERSREDLYPRHATTEANRVWNRALEVADSSLSCEGDGTELLAQLGRVGVRGVGDAGATIGLPGAARETELILLDAVRVDAD